MRVHSFETMAAVDGLGVRCCVFLTGCPLRCAYCHNPDTWQYGTEYTPQALAAKLRRFRPYFRNGGGVTFSGGEPLLQAQEIVQTSALLQESGIDYALDTSGAVALDAPVRTAIDGAQMVLCDLKFPDETSMRRYTGGALTPVLETLAYLAQRRKTTWVRTVIVPGINDTPEAIARYAAVLRQFPHVRRWQLLGFHTMGFEKYRKLGLPNPLENCAAMDPAALQNLQGIADRLWKQQEEDFSNK